MDIKSVIKGKGYTLNSVADMMGVNRVSFSQTISNNPTIKTLRRIADIIGCDIADFFEDERRGSTERVFTCECGRKYRIEEIKPK